MGTQRATCSAAVLFGTSLPASVVLQKENLLKVRGGPARGVASRCAITKSDPLDACVDPRRSCCGTVASLRLCGSYSSLKTLMIAQILR